MRERLPIVLSAAALVVALLGVTPLGQAAGSAAANGLTTAKVSLGGAEFGAGWRRGVGGSRSGSTGRDARRRGAGRRSGAYGPGTRGGAG